MFYNDVDHSSYLLEDLEALEKMPGYPFSRFNNIEASANDDEQLIMALNGGSGELLVITTKKVAVYKIPRTKSLFKKSIGFAVGFVPGVSDVVDGIDDLKSGVSNAKNFTSWVSGKNKRLAKEREAAGMPSRKHFKDVTWNLKKPEIKGLVLAYRDDILMANGFGWKTKFQNNHDNTIPTKVILKKYSIDIHIGKLKWYFSLSTKDDISLDVIKEHSHLFKNTSELVIPVKK